MTDELIVWMAKTLSDEIKGPSREGFLRSLKYDKDKVVNEFITDIEQLLMLYRFREDEVSCASTDIDHPEPFINCAKLIVEYMRDDLLKDELEQISQEPSETPRLNNVGFNLALCTNKKYFL